MARLIRGAELITIPGMGHALSRAVIEPLAAAILAHTDGPPQGDDAS